MTVTWVLAYIGAAVAAGCVRLVERMEGRR